jgi:PPK2 family polyphosphate:nucleotide phosphotransferase
MKSDALAATFASRFGVKPQKRVRLRDYDPAWTGGRRSKSQVAALLAGNLERLNAAQDRLWSSQNYSLLIILQAMDTAGKDGLIKHVMGGMNPQSCYVVPFKQPSAEELSHNFLWRYENKVPAFGNIGIFNRSHYEEVLVVRVHPELLANEHVSAKHLNRLWRERYHDINHFEQHLARNRTVILKFFLHLSKEEQKRRLLARLDNPAKHWKFSPSDLAERQYWDDYQTAYEDALSATSTAEAPWYIIPADHKWVTRWVVSEITTRTIERLDLKIPRLSKEQDQALAAARRSLEKE